VTRSRACRGLVRTRPAKVCWAAVVVRAGAADGFPFGEPLVVHGQGVQAQEPVFVGVLVGEAGVVGSGVSEGDSDVQVAILDRAGDEPARAADDVPGEGSSEPGQGDRAVRVGWDLIGVQVLVAGVVVDPAGQGAEVVGEFLGCAAFSEAGYPALAGQSRGVVVTANGVHVCGEQQRVRVQPFEQRDGVSHRLDGGPGVGPLLTLSDLVAFVVAGGFPVSAGDGPQSCGGFVPDAAAFEVEDYWWSVAIRTVHYS